MNDIDLKIKETTEKQIKVFCPNCINCANFDKVYSAKKLKEIIEEKSQPINTLQSRKDGEQYNGEFCEWHIFKHFSCNECGEKFIASYALTLEKNLTLDEALEQGKNDGRLYNTYRF